MLSTSQIKLIYGFWSLSLGSKLLIEYILPSFLSVSFLLALAYVIIFVFDQNAK